MLRKDGKYQVFMIQHQQPKGNWCFSSFDYFGTPNRGFSASGACWQETGIRGTFDDIEARDGLAWIREKHAEHKFRVVRLIITQKTLQLPW
jgi:hypothetical protein